MTVDGEGGARERRRPEGALVEPRPRIPEAAPIAGQHLDIGEAMVPEGHRLGRLQVGEARHHRPRMGQRLLGQRPLQVGRLGVEGIQVSRTQSFMSVAT